MLEIAHSKATRNTMLSNCFMASAKQHPDSTRARMAGCPTDCCPRNYSLHSHQVRGFLNASNTSPYRYDTMPQQTMCMEASAVSRQENCSWSHTASLSCNKQHPAHQEQHAEIQQWRALLCAQLRNSGFAVPAGTAPAPTAGRIGVACVCC